MTDPETLPPNATTEPALKPTVTGPHYVPQHWSPNGHGNVYRRSDKPGIDYPTKAAAESAT